MKNVSLSSLFKGLLLISVFSLLFWFFAISSRAPAFARYFTRRPSHDSSGGNLGLKKLRNKVLIAAKHLAKAHRYARSSKTILELEKAYDELISGLGDANNDLTKTHLSDSGVLLLSPNDSVKAGAGGEVEVCPETWGGKNVGYPFYEESFQINCTGYKPQPLNQLLTLLINLVDEARLEDFSKIAEDLSQTHSSYNHYSVLNIVVSVETDNKRAEVEQIMEEHGLIGSVIGVKRNSARGPVIGQLLERVKTKYVILFRDVIRINSLSRLERLVRLLSHIDADFVGGSQRNSTGHWVAGCYQMAVRNYTMRVVEGYDLSFNSCMYCDYLSGPFAVRTQLLASMVDEALTGEQFYADLWIRSRDNRIVVSCPDSMFYTLYSGFSQSMKSDWIAFVRKHQLNKLILPTGYEYHYTCKEAKTSCSLSLGKMVPLCCLQELTDLLVFTSKEFDRSGIGYQLDSGNLIGAVKLGGTLPWEIDADYMIRAQNISTVVKLEHKFKMAGYKISELVNSNHENKSTCMNSTTKVNCGYVSVSSDNWNLELWGVNWLSNDKLASDGFPVTRVNCAGYWAVTPQSPAACARNRFDDDIFKHEEHWRTLGRSSSFQHYQSGQFRQCSTPGFHGCFRGNYLPLGNLQFKEVWI